MYKHDLLQNITDALDMRHYKGMMKNIKAPVYGRRYYCDFGNANHGSMTKRSHRSS